MTLSINDISSYFGVETATVERWVRQGRIAAFRQDGSLRFRKKDIDKWAAQQNIHLKPQNSVDETPEDEIPSLTQALENGGVYHNIEGGDKNAVFSACIEKMALIPADFKLDLLERLKEREEAMSTGIGNGIAIPHPREPLAYIPKSAVVTCFLKSPVEFDALDNKPVHLVFFLLSTSLTHHLPMLSALSRCLKDNRFRSFLDSRPGVGALIEQMKQMDL